MTIWHGGALKDARASSNLASLVRGMLEAAKQSVPQEHSHTPSSFSLDLGTTVFLD